jgi:hypothetical protein
METIELEALFTLNVVAPHLEGFRPPEGPHNPQGDWTLAYGVYTLGSIRGHGGRIGKLTVRREATGDGGAVVGIDYQKRVNPGFSQSVVAEITCRGDVLGTPVRWTYASEIVDPAQGPLQHTTLKKSAAAKDGWVEIDDGRNRRRLSVGAPFTVNWALFEAVGRLPREPFDPVRFTMLDHFDQVKAGQVLSYRRSADVALGGRPVRLHAYDQLGEGIVPWIYWADERGRLLFAISGLEAYLVDSFRRP